MSDTGSQAIRSTAEVARAAFSPGFFTGATLREEHRTETGLRLAYALRAEGLQPWQLHALALAVRDVGDRVPFDAEAPLTPEQLRLLRGIQGERALPAPLRGVLDAALPAISRRKDLAAFYGVLSGGYERWSHIDAVQQLPQPPTR